MPSEMNIDGEFKVCVKKDLLPQFLSSIETYSPLIPEIWGESNKGEEYWLIRFCYIKKDKEQ